MELRLRFLFVIASWFIAPSFAAYATAALQAQAPVPPALRERILLAQPEVYTYASLPARKMANGGESRPVLHGTLPEGEALSVHESILTPELTPNTPHRIQHCEVITVISGTVAFEHDGQSQKAGPGDIIFVAQGTLHTLRNIGSVPARYSVVALGGDVR